MRSLSKYTRPAVALTSVVCALAVGASTASAAAPTGEYAVFKDCPLENPNVSQCLYSKVTSGEVKLGNTTVPIKNPMTLQGGLEGTTNNQMLVGAVNGGETLSKTPEPVPGGLLGLVNCDELSGLLQALCKATFENGVTGVNAVTELAGAPETVIVNSANLVEEEEVALKLPVKVHLENPLLGSNCYIGSASNPVTFELTTGTTAPPPPAKPISGKRGTFEFREGGDLVVITGAKLVDNAFAAPGVHGCGALPFSELLLDPIIDAKLALPSAAGNNLAILNTNIEKGYAPAVRESE